MSNIRSIKFPAVWEDIEGNEGSGLAEFKLGPGPCGKTVTRLTHDLDQGCLRVIQSHSDGTSKDFIYQLDDIVGRIEVEYA